jgi:hypothetical protein
MTRQTAWRACASLLFAGAQFACCGQLDPAPMTWYCCSSCDAASSYRVDSYPTTTPCHTGEVADYQCPLSSNCVEASRGAAFRYVGNWSGHVDFEFPSGSNAVAIALDPSPNMPAGTVTFGRPPVTYLDPAVGMPADGTFASFINEGFPFTIREVELDQQGLRFSICQSEQWQSWCQSQTYYQWAEPFGRLCVPEGEVVDSSGTCSIQPTGATVRLAYDCAKIALCKSGICGCDCVAAQCGTTSRWDGLLRWTAGHLEASMQLLGRAQSVQLTARNPWPGGV